jgi:hypothetical protein
MGRDRVLRRAHPLRDSAHRETFRLEAHEQTKDGQAGCLAERAHGGDGALFRVLTIRTTAREHQARGAGAVNHKSKFPDYWWGATILTSACFKIVTTSWHLTGDQGSEDAEQQGPRFFHTLRGCGGFDPKASARGVLPTVSLSTVGERAARVATFPG